MSGITGYVEFDTEQIGNDIIYQMSNAIRHRGPDYEDTYSCGNVAFGQRYIIGSNTSIEKQKMISHDNEFAITFDGAIYNYEELRLELEDSGIELQTNTDTEIILEMYRKHGLDCVNSFNGVWAFVIHDKIKQKLLFSRDRVGIKPLYYLLTDDSFTFASEIKAILHIHPEQRLPDEQYIREFLTTAICDYGEDTFFRNIKSLPAAYNAILDIETAVISFEQYWTIDEELFYKKYISGKNPVDVFEDLISSSVAMQMNSGKNIGTCLSGGIDSSLITALASKDLNHQINTISSWYHDKGYNEKKYIDYVNNYIGASPISVDAEPKGNFVELLKTITWHQDEPSAGPGLIPHFFIMQAATKNVQILLDGQGADELFCGYYYFIPGYIMELIQSKSITNKIKALRLAVNFLLHWPGYAAQLVPYALRHIRKSFRKTHRQKEEKYNNEFTNGFIMRTSEPLSSVSSETFSNPVSNLCYDQLTRNSIPRLLRCGDRNSMAFSVETRTPMLDYRIVEFALGLPPEHKIHGACWTKWPLRKLCDKLLLKKVAWRRDKMGYPTPFYRWLKKGDNVLPLKNVIEQFKARNIIKPEVIERYYNRHMSGKADHSLVIYKYIALEIWYQIYIDDLVPHYADSYGGKTNNDR